MTDTADDRPTPPSPPPGPSPAPPPYYGATQTNPDHGLAPAYAQPPQFVAVPFKDTSGTNAVVGLVMGIIALLLCWIPFVGIVSWVIGGLGMLFSVLGFRQDNASRAMTIVGIVLNGLALVVCVIYLLGFIALLGGSGGSRV